jgi:Virulence factor BrkB
MSRVIQCPHCRASGSVSRKAVGKAVQCSGCRAEFVVPPSRTVSTREIKRAVTTGIAIFGKTLTVVAEAVGASRFLWASWRQVGISFRIVFRALQQWPSNQNSAAGAALAFYAVFAIVPLAFLAVLSCGFFFGEERATDQFEGWMKKAVGQEIGADVADDLEGLLDAIKVRISESMSLGRFWTRSFWILAGSIVVHIAGVLALFTQARVGLCVIWKIQFTQATTLRMIVVDYVLAVVMVVFLIAVLFTSLFIGTWIPNAPLVGDGFHGAMCGTAPPSSRSCSLLATQSCSNTCSICTDRISMVEAAF